MYGALCHVCALPERQSHRRGNLLLSSRKALQSLAKLLGYEDRSPVKGNENVFGHRRISVSVARSCEDVAAVSRQQWQTEILVYPEQSI